MGLGLVYAEAGKREPKRDHPLSYFMAAVYALLGERDQALECLDKAYEGRVSQLVYLRVNPTFESLHDDPRFADLLRRIGLPP